jgi:hypothetical protein
MLPVLAALEAGEVAACCGTSRRRQPSLEQSLRPAVPRVLEVVEREVKRLALLGRSFS